MVDSIAKITLDLQQASSPVTVSVKLGDIGRKIVIVLSDGGFPYEITEDCYAVLTATKPDGNILYNRCDIVDNAIIYSVTAQTTAAAGRLPAEVKLYGAEDKLITSATFRLLVHETVCQDEQIESTGEASALTHLVSQTLEIEKRSGELIAAAEQAAQVVEQAAELVEEAINNANAAADRADKFPLVADEAKQKAEEAIRNVNTLREVVSKFHSNIVEEASGEVITISDSAEAPLQGLKVFGRTEQFTTTGKNLIPNNATTQTLDGITYTVKDDGSITANGTASSRASKFTITLSEPLPAADYIMTGCPIGGTANTYLLTAFDGTYYYEDIGNGRILTNISVKEVNIWVRPGVTVNNLTFYPMIRPASNTDSAYEPYTGGIPAPNPDYPQTLDSVGADGRVDVTVFGKNLLQNTAKTATQNGVTFTVNEDGTITANGTNDSGSSASCTLSQYKEIPGEWIGKDFIISGGVHADALVEIGFACSDGSSYSVRSTTVENRFTVADNVTHWFASIRVLNGVSLSNVVFRPMLRLASVTDNTYEPYKKQTLSITTPNGLPGIPVASGGNYTDGSGQQWICDEVDFEKGVYVQRVEKRVFTGTEAFRLHASGRYYLDIANGRFAITDTWGLFSNDVSREGGTQFGSSGVYFKTAHSTVDEFKAYLADNYASGQPITAQIVLRTFTETALSAEQLAAFALLHTNCPNTTVFNDKNAGMKVKYVADTKLYIDKKFAELATALVNNV